MRVLTHLTKKDVEFKWTPECENCLQILKEFLQQAPILKYPDPKANYTLYIDASKYAYAGVLTQDTDGTDHPITYVRGIFRGSQLNWTTLTKEAYAIYMSVRKLCFYIDTAKITVKSDHLPLKKFLEKNTLNSKVNNWAVELESQDITFEYIPGRCNTLADTLSRLIEMDEDIKLQPEEEGKEFVYFPFKELPPVTTQVIEEVIECEIGNINIQHLDPVQVNNDISIPLKNKKLVKLQESDPHTSQLRKQWENNNLDKNTYTMENNILKQKIVDNGLLYTPIVVPDILKDCLLILAHDKQGHNGFRRTYALLKNRYHWKMTKCLVRMNRLNIPKVDGFRLEYLSMKLPKSPVTTPNESDYDSDISSDTSSGSSGGVSDFPEEESGSPNSSNDSSMTIGYTPPHSDMEANSPGSTQDMAIMIYEEEEDGPLCPSGQKHGCDRFD